MFDEESRAAITAHGIKLQAESMAVKARDRWQCAALEQGLEGSRKLASYPGGEDTAMELLVHLLSGYDHVICAWVDEHRYERYPPYRDWSEQQETQNYLEELMYDRFMAGLASGTYWDPQHLLEQMEQRMLQGHPDLAKSQWFDPDTGPFQLPVWYAQHCQRWCVAQVLAAKAAGNKLPPELVLMIGEYVYGGPDLRIAPYETG